MARVVASIDRRILRIEIGIAEEDDPQDVSRRSVLIDVRGNLCALAVTGQDHFRHVFAGACVHARDFLAQPVLTRDD